MGVAGGQSNGEQSRRSPTGLSAAAATSTASPSTRFARADMSTSELNKSANQFAVNLFHCYLSRHGDRYRNLLLCPYLIYHSLAMMLAGARGNTAKQLVKLLCIPAHLVGNGRQSVIKSTSSLSSADATANDMNRHKEFLLLTEQLLHGNHDFVHLASFIYLDKSTKRTERYKQVVRDFYETKPKKIEFENVDVMVKTINEDVARTTENIYHEILSRQEAKQLDKSYMLLVNAVFFRGFWLSNFSEVKQAPFVGVPPPSAASSASTTPLSGSPSSSPQPQPSSPGASIKLITNPVDYYAKDSPAAAKLLPNIQHQQQPAQQPSQCTVKMMSKLDYLPIVNDEQLDARIVRMPFEASDLQMLIILPNNRLSDSKYLCEKINALKIDSIFNEFDKSKSRTVRVSMPIFCIDSGKISIQSTLVQMGASDLFDKSRANMSGVCENKPVWLNKILHRCFIICDNRGSITSSAYEKARRRHAKLREKSESTTIAASTTTNVTNIVDFTADHPFLYIIADSVTRTILLIGLFTDPSETLEVVHENQLTPEEAHQIYLEGVYKT